MLYQQELAGTDLETIFTEFEELQTAPASTREFAENLVRGVAAMRDELDARLAEQTEHWRLERMAAVDRNILRVALYELLVARETPALVVIDEAVEIAKRFGSERSSQFVNGILDGVLQRERAAGNQ